MKWHYWPIRPKKPKTTSTALASENAELRSLLSEIYDWTAYKHTRWARRSAKALGLDKEDNHD